MDKKRLVVISKSDMLDEELKNEIRKEFPKDIGITFISSFDLDSFVVLKDKLWELI